MIHVVAPSRLHFGLFHVPVAGEQSRDRVFGGVGLMVDTPGVAVAAKPADSWQFEGMLASRAQEFAMWYTMSLPEEERRAYQVLVERCPAEHTGLGVGTQLGLAVAKALAVAHGRDNAPATELAARVGRGERSAIGVHGFDRGGLITELGKRPGEDVSPLVEHVALPRQWRVVLFNLPSSSAWHGARERMAFANAGAGDPEALRRIAQTAILPAARSADIQAFGAAVHEFNRKAGEPFVAAQGGPYASRAIEELIADVRAAGIRGVGQSSWGPTVFAVVPDADTAMSLVLRFNRRVPVTITRASAGAVVSGAA
jgi:beta-RFAP synthase